MRYAFLGTTEFSAAILKQLVAHGYRPELVVTNPDRPSGRKKIITPPPLKVVAHETGVPVFQPEQLNATAAETLSRIHADCFILVDYGKIIPDSFLRFPRLGIIGIHPSLLPAYRGPSPLQTALLHGDIETGITLYILDREVDHGPMIAQKKFPLSPELSYLELRVLAAEQSAELLIDTLPEFLTGNIVPREQNHAQATHTKKFSSDDGFVPPRDLDAALSGNDHTCAVEIDRKIRALNPEPGVWTTKDGKRLKLLEARIQNSRLVLTITQREGEKPRAAKST